MCPIVATVRQDARSERFAALCSGLRAALERLAARLRSSGCSDPERYFAGCRDRFDLEKRERDWIRRNGADGSLLGQ